MKPLSLRDTRACLPLSHQPPLLPVRRCAGGRRRGCALRLPIDKTLRKAEWRELAGVPFAYDTKRYYTLKVENAGPRIRAFIDGKLVLEASDNEILQGQGRRHRRTGRRASRTFA